MNTYIVAEIASNWEGSISKAKKLILESKKAGANAVKFQMWRANDLYSKANPQWKIIKKSELTFEKAEKLKKYADSQNIEFFCSVFYPEGVNCLESLGVKKYKIASRTCLLNDKYSLETLESVARTRKPVIISMGMGGNKKRIMKIFSKNKITFCYCISEYPTPFKKINWKEAMKYDGFSDHSIGIVAPFLFGLLKKERRAKCLIIEKHVKLRNSRGPDASTSMTIELLKELVSKIRVIEKLSIKKC
jgi:sialic acid synthase SpsE